MTKPLRYPGLELDLFAHAHFWKSYLRESLRAFLHGHILEVGAGIGSNTKHLITGEVTSWDCLEPDPILYARLEREIRSQFSLLSVHAFQGTLSSLSCEKRYTTILYLDVLEHIPDDTSELAEAASYLDDGGHLVVLAPAHDWLYSSFDHQLGHFRRYTKRGLLGLTPKNMHPIISRYLDAFGILASLGNRFILKQGTPSKSGILLWDQVLVPCSRLLDPLTGYRLGKSLLLVWERG